MARQKKVLFEGIETGHESAIEQFEKATGKKFYPSKYEILWNGAEQSDDYGASMGFQIVNKSRINKSIVENQKEDIQQEVDIEKGEIKMEEEIKRLEEELRQTRQRQREYREAGAYDQEAAEASNASRLAQQIAELRQPVVERKINNNEKDGNSIDNNKIKWHPKLTKEQIEELIAEGIEPGDNEYEEYLINHGIFPVKNVEEVTRGGVKEAPTPVPIQQTPQAKSEKSKFDITYVARTGTYEYKGINKDGQEVEGTIRQEKKFWRKKDKYKTMQAILGDDYDAIFSGFKSKDIKNFDSKLLQILYVNLGARACRDYLLELSCGDKAKRENMQHTMKYNLHGIENTIDRDGKVGVIDRIRIENMARGNRYVSDVSPEKIKTRWGIIAAALGLSLVTLIGGLGKAIGGKDTPKLPDNIPDRTMTDGEVPGIKEPEITLEVEPEPELEPSWIDTIKVEDIYLGMEVDLPEGITFTENSLGQGRKNITGHELSPAGTYIVDGVSIVKDGKIVTSKYMVDKEFDLNNYIVENTKNGEEVKFHINLGTGHGVKENGKYTGEHPRGWVDSQVVYDNLPSKYKTSHLRYQGTVEAKDYENVQAYDIEIEK